MSNLRGLRATSSFLDQEYGIVDSGCTRTVSSNERVFEDLVMSSNTGYNLTLANDAQEEVAGLGYVGGLPALFAPGIGEDTLLSVMDITARGINVAFTVSEVILIHGTTGEVLYKCTRRENAYVLRLSELKRILDQMEEPVEHHCEANRVRVGEYMNVVERIDFMHERLGHQPINVIVTAIERNLVDGIDDLSIEQLSVHKDKCDVCVEANLKRLPYLPRLESVVPLQDLVKRPKVTGAVISMDYCFLDYPSVFKCKNILCLYDNGSQCGWMYEAASRDEVVKLLHNWFHCEVKAFKRTVEDLRCDNPKEFTSGAIRKYCADAGINLQFSTVYNSQQNGAVERFHAIVYEKARAAIHASAVSYTSLYFEACKYVLYIHIRLRAAGNNKSLSRYTEWYGRRATLDHCPPWGIKCFAKKEDIVNLSKFERRADEGIFVGFSPEFFPGYRVYNIYTKTIDVFRNVEFSYGRVGRYLRLLNDPEAHVDEINAVSDLYDQYMDSRREEKILRDGEKKAKRKRAIEGSGTETRSGRKYKMARIGSVPYVHRIVYGPEVPPVYMAYSARSDVYKPVDIEDAITCPDKDEWIQSAKVEINAFEYLNVFEVVKDERGLHKTSTKYVITLKKKDDGGVKRKVRLVLRGFSQIFGLEYDQTFSPVVKPSTTRMILTLATLYNWKLVQTDITNAYLNARLDKPLYIDAPKGFRKWEEVQFTEKYLCDKDECLKVLGAVYGTKQAGRMWNRLFARYIVEQLGYQQSINDLCLFFKFMPECEGEYKINFIIIYVDDTISVGVSLEESNRTVEGLLKRFRVTQPDVVKKFVGLEITRDPIKKLMYIGMDEYIDKIIKFFGIESDEEYPPLEVPMTASTVLSRDQCPETEEGKREMKKIPFMEGVGLLRYLVDNVRFDMFVALGMISQFSSNPGMAHWLALVDLARYLKGTRNYRLVLGRRSKPSDEASKFNLTAWADASFADDVDSRRSRSGGAIFMDLTPLVVYSRKQNNVVTSTTAAEIASLRVATDEILFLQNLFREIKLPMELPTPIMEDNQAAIALSADPGSRTTKHLEIYMHYIRELVEEGVIKLEYVPSKEQKADILTKILSDKTDFIQQRDMLGIVEFQQDVAVRRSVCN